MFTYIVNLFKESKLRRHIGKLGKESKLFFPVMLGRPDLLFMDDYTRVMPHAKLVLNKGKLFIGKFTAIGPGLTVVTDNHTPTVGLPYFFTGSRHVNDRSVDIHVGEDCWIGANVTMLPGCEVGRGTMVGACALLNKKYPPYAFLAGVPAKIKGVKFSKEQILKHEEMIYPIEERMTKEEIEYLFTCYYNGMKVMGSENLSEEDYQAYIESRKI